MKKTMLKRGAALFLAFVMVFGMLPFASLAAEPVEPVDPVEEEQIEAVFEEQDIEPEEQALQMETDGSVTYHVANAASGGDDDNEGGHEAPLLTIRHAMELAQAASATELTICLDSDVYAYRYTFEMSGMAITVKSCPDAGRVERLYFSGTEKIGNEAGFINVLGTDVSFESIALEGSQGSIDGRVLYVADGGVVHLTDTTVSKGRVEDADLSHGGAGIYVADRGEAYLGAGVQIKGNSTQGGGAGIYVADGGYAELTDDAKISGNTSSSGLGAVYAATQTGSYGGLKISGGAAITGNDGGGLYVQKAANAMVEGDVAVSGNELANKSICNVSLAEEATLDISGTTTGADLGISAEPEYAYRLISLPSDYTILKGLQGDEQGWHDDCGAWDIRYMTYGGVPGLYLCAKSLDASFSNVDTLTAIHGTDINGEQADFLNDGMTDATNAGGTLTVPGIVLKGSEFVVRIQCDPEDYRIPTEDIVTVTSNGEEVPFTYEADFEAGTATITIAADIIDSLDSGLVFGVSAEKLYSLTIAMDGPMYEMAPTSITGLTETKLVLSGQKTGESAEYVLTQDGAPAAGIQVTLYREGSTSGSVPSQTTDDAGIVRFTGLDPEGSYFPVLRYERTYRVVGRDVIELSLSSLDGQQLSAAYTSNTGDVAYDTSTGKAVISGVAADGTVRFSVEQSEDAIAFVSNDEMASTKQATLTLGGVSEKGMIAKTMEASASTYGVLAQAELIGYTFLGWYTEPEGGALVTAGTRYATLDSAKTLYAHWQANDDTAYGVEHWVEYADGGVNCHIEDNGSQKKTVDGKVYYLYDSAAYQDGTSDAVKDIAPLALESVNCGEHGWWSLDGFDVKPEEDCIVLADGSSTFSIYYDRKTFQISFKNEGAGTADQDEQTPAQDATFGAPIGELPVPTLPGYAFGGWHDGDQQVSGSDIYRWTEDLELTARWNARNDTKWAIKVAVQDLGRYPDGGYYALGTYTEYLTVWKDDAGKMLVGRTDTTVSFSVSDFKALDIEGFRFVGYASEFDRQAEGMTASDDEAQVYVKPTDMATDVDGSYDKSFDGGLVWLYFDRLTAKVVSTDGQGNEYDEGEIVYGGDFTGHLPEDPAKDGYDFDGWVDPDGDPVTEDTPTDEYVVDEDGEIEVDPTWTAREYNLVYVPGANASFKAAAGSGMAVPSKIVPGGYVDPNAVTYDEPVGTMPTASKRGHDFDGWALADGTWITSDTIVDISTVVISNADKAPPYGYEDTRPLYAQFTVHQYTLRLDPGASSVTGVKGTVSPESVQVTFGGKVSGLPTPKLTGYRFVAWVMKVNGSTVVVRNGDVWDRSSTNGAIFGLYATWVPESYRYTFDLNDSAGSTRAMLVIPDIEYLEVAFDSSYEGAFAVEAIRNGYDFMGWTLNRTGPVLTADDLNALTSNATLYAIWQPKQYDVRLVLRGSDIGDLSESDPSASYDEETDTWTIKVPFDTTYGDLPIPVKSDCTFHGWLADAPGWPAEGGYGVTIDGQTIRALPQYIDFTDEAGITLTAVLEPWMTFDPAPGAFADDGSEEPRKTIQSDIDELPEAELPGHTFRGWQDEDGEPVGIEDIEAAEEPMTLSPIFVPNVVLDPDGGKFVDDGSEDPRTIPSDDLPDELPKAEKPGYSFDGWGDLEDADGPVTIKPVFRANITFDGNGGTVQGAATWSVRLDQIEAAPSASRPGYTFAGWYTASSGGSAIDLAALIAANVPVTVYARWNIIPSGGGGGWTRPPAVDIVDTDPPLSEDPCLFRDDHIAYVKGYGDGTVRPNANITRAEVAMIFYRLLADNVRVQYESTTSRFSDVADDAWYTTAIATLTNMGILRGRTSDRFAPNASITRAEFAAIAARFDELTGGELTFTDVPADHWAYAEIASAAAKGWVRGYGDGTFKPNASITRAESVTLINRVLGRDTLTADGLIHDGMITWPDSHSDAWYWLDILEATNAHEAEMTDEAEHWTELHETTMAG